MLTVRLFVDIGGTGAKADAFALWAGQFVGQEIRWLKYYEAVGQPLEAHLAWCRTQGYTPGKAQFWLPHDGATNDRVYDVSYESALKAAGYKVTVVPNQGKGAAMKRIEEARRLFPVMWFDEEGCKGGLDALGWYHEKEDEVRNIGLGPDHDWACLPAGERIRTPDGYKRVEDFRAGDKVVTGGKIGLVVRAQYVKDSVIYRFVLRDGSVVRCSPEHKLFTRLGLVMAKDLRQNDALLQPDEISQWLVSSLGTQKAFTEHILDRDWETNR